jgi:hypothetical protein
MYRSTDSRPPFGFVFGFRSLAVGTGFFGVGFFVLIDAGYDVFCASDA